MRSLNIAVIPAAMRLLPGVSGPLAGRTAADVDMICVRENSEGEYSGFARVARFAFELAR